MTLVSLHPVVISVQCSGARQDHIDDSRCTGIWGMGAGGGGGGSWNPLDDDRRHCRSVSDSICRPPPSDDESTLFDRSSRSARE